MPTRIEEIAAKTATDTASAATAKIPGNPLVGMKAGEIALALLLWGLPFIIIGGIIFFGWKWYRDQSQLQENRVFLKNHTVKGIDTKKDAHSFDLDKKHYEYDPKLAPYFTRHWFWGFVRPVHYFKEGNALELAVTDVFYAPDDANPVMRLLNASYLHTKLTEKRTAAVFSTGSELGFTIVLAIAVGLAGLIIGYILHDKIGVTNSAAAAAKAVTTTTIAAVARR